MLILDNWIYNKWKVHGKEAEVALNVNLLSVWWFYSECTAGIRKTWPQVEHQKTVISMNTIWNLLSDLEVALNLTHDNFSIIQHHLLVFHSSTCCVVVHYVYLNYSKHKIESIFIWFVHLKVPMQESLGKQLWEDKNKLDQKWWIKFKLKQSSVN